MLGVAPVAEGVNRGLGRHGPLCRGQACQGRRIGWILYIVKTDLNMILFEMWEGISGFQRMHWY